ncbi:MAG TPA: hypothetical protein VHC39_08775 [Rhizomicrobium sp.]|nr:hypothetical protein [Rhizomicrobium sp.]
MRVIIRFSLNGSNRAANRLRRDLGARLEAQGIMRDPKSTSTYEGDASEDAIRLALRGFWQEIHTFIGNAHLDHFWMYADQGPPKKLTLEDLDL